MKKAIDVLRHLPEEKAELAAAAIIAVAAADDAQRD